METNDILIIGRNHHPDGKETAALIQQSLQPYLETKGLSGQLVLFKDIVFDISNENVRIFDATSGRDLKDFKAALMTNWFSHASIRKDLAFTLALYFEANGIPCLNTEALHSRSTSKVSQMMLAALHDVPIPRTIFSLSLEHLTNYLQELQFPAPFIFKNAQASRGQGNYVLASIDDIEKHTSEHSETAPFMVQTFILSEGADYRFFVTGGDTKLIIKRIGNGESHLHNTSAGASTVIIPIEEMDEKTLQSVHVMSQMLHREVTGIDIMFDIHTAKPYFLEANPIPQIATGSNTERKLEALATALQDIAKGGTT